MAAISSSYKVILLGDKDVGKTSIILRYTHNEFRQDTSFLPMGEQTKKLNINGQDVSLEIWDTAGQEKYKSLETHYFRDADAAVLVYSIVDEESFECMCDYWIKQVVQFLPDEIPILVVGNKSDLAENESCCVDLNSVIEYTTAYGLPFPIETSAKTGENINKVFTEIAKALYKRYNCTPQAQKGQASTSACCGGTEKPRGDTKNLTVHY